MSDPLSADYPLYHYSGIVYCTKGFCLDCLRVGEGSASRGTGLHFDEERSRDIDSTQ